MESLNQRLKHAAMILAIFNRCNGISLPCARLLFLAISFCGLSLFAQTLETEGTVMIASSAEITFRAKERIILKPGFVAKSGCKFLATVGASSNSSAGMLSPSSSSSTIVAKSEVENINGSNDADSIQALAKQPEDGAESAIPQRFSLAQNYPNPFNPETAIGYQLPEAGFVSLSIYNMLGQRVVTLRDEHTPAGYHQAIWDGRGEAGRDVASGIYLYRLEVKGDNGGFVAVKKMNLLR
jgi:hypothetical protein